MATVFVGGSALLLAGAMAALAFGFANGEDSLVWTALVASAGAAVFLVFAYVISRRELRRARPAAGPDEAATRPAARAEEPRSEAVAAPERNDANGSAEESEQPEGSTGGQGAGEEADQTVSGLPAAATMSGGSPTAKPSGANKKPSAPGTAATTKPSSPSDAVVGIATKKKFHRTDCRYAASDSAEEMTRATARKRGYTPCGICKP